MYGWCKCAWRKFSLSLASAALCALPWPATAADPIAVESGGVSSEHFAAMSARASGYSFKLLLAAKGSGAYLADVDVTVRALPGNEVVVQHRSQGPLLLAALPPGRYSVEARYGPVRPGAPATIQRQVSIPQSGRADVVMHFETSDKVGE